MAAKTVRQQDKARGIKTKPANPLRGAGFPKSEKPKKAIVYRPVTFYREDTP
jgi:hypothetical protein